MTLRAELVRMFPALAQLPPHAFVVGGAIRDLLQGKTPADIDVTCRDPYGCAEAISPRVIRLGRDHLSAYRVVVDEQVYDFAPLLDNDIDRDLARRDFTVNAMALPLDRDELLDPHGGQRDLTSRVVRMIGPKNFTDDPLRTLKGIRMAVRYQFTIEPETIRAIHEHAMLITTVAAERVDHELSLIFSSNEFRKAVALLRESHLDAPIFGRELDASKFHADDLSFAASLALLVDEPKIFAERWRIADSVLRDVQALKRLAVDHSVVELYDAGESAARQLGPMLRALGRSDDFELPDFTTVPYLTGNEIASMTGREPGPELGRVKRSLLEAQIRGEVCSREEAVAFVTSMSS